MFGIGVTELLLILGVALLVLGPQKLPEVAAMLGRGLREFRKTARELEEELEPVRNAFDRDLYDEDEDLAATAEQEQAAEIRPPDEPVVGLGETTSDNDEPDDDQLAIDHPEFEADFPDDDERKDASPSTVTAPVMVKDTDGEKGAPGGETLEKPQPQVATAPTKSTVK